MQCTLSFLCEDIKKTDTKRIASLRFIHLLLKSENFSIPHCILCISPKHYFSLDYESELYEHDSSTLAPSSSSKLPGSKFEKCYVFHRVVRSTLNVFHQFNRALGWDEAWGWSNVSSSLLCLQNEEWHHLKFSAHVTAWWWQSEFSRKKILFSNPINPQPLNVRTSTMESLLFIDVNVLLESTGNVNDWWNEVDVKMFM